MPISCITLRSFITPFMDTRPEKKHRTVGYIVITGDKGLAGAYNHNVLKLAEEKLAATENPVLFVIGQVGRAYFAGKNVNVDGEFLYTAQDPTVTRARDISETMVGRSARPAGRGACDLHRDGEPRCRRRPATYQLLPLTRSSSPQGAPVHRRPVQPAGGVRSF